MSKLQKKIISILMCVAAAGTVLADDDHVKFKNEHKTKPFDISVRGINGDVSLSLGVGTLSFNDDGHHTTLFGSGDFDTVCADLFNPIHGGEEWDCHLHNSNSASAAGLIRAGKIVQWVGDTVATGNDLNNLTMEQSVGLQLAVWEAIYDTEVPPMTRSAFHSDLTHGNFKITSAFSSGANLYLDSAWSFYMGGFSYATGAVYLETTGSGPVFGQNQFAYDHSHILTTPEPITMGLGFAGVGLYIRRRFKPKKA